MPRRLSASDFSPGSEGPVLPLRAEGEIWHVGWDIPSRWAVDADGRVFLDASAHGGWLYESSFDIAIAHAEVSGDPGTGAELRRLAGRRQRLPEWAAEALRRGWTPSTDFRREDYE